MLPLFAELQDKIAVHGLHHVVAARLRGEGFKVAELSDLFTAVGILGAKLYEKNAEYRRIIEGLRALQDVERG
jgi:hypothetical protein